MCNTNTKKSNSIKKKKKQPARRSRTKTRKPKYLSLSKHIKTLTTTTITKMTRSNHHNPQLTLFPLHPENLVDDRSFGDENVADLLFDSESVPGDASLSGLLTTTTTATTVSEEEQDDSMSYGRVFDENDNESLVKTAMKRRHSERDATEEEKWVCYSEVVEETTSASSSKGINVISRGSSSSNAAKKKNKKKKKKRKLAETTSSLVSQEGNSTTTNGSNSLSSLALKLDYQEILKAWSDKGSLYIQGGDLSPQTVPDIYNDHHPGLMDGWGSSAGNLWKVPESGGLKIKEEIEVEGKDGLKLGQREASVLRYKEKRQSRLFAKRIRYEVRKLNAEKRPRMKGRFVKII